MPSIGAWMARSALRALPLYNGKGRLVDRTWLRRLHFRETVLDVSSIDGVIRVNPNDLVGRQIYLTRTFDRCVVDVLASLARPGDTLWDIGANVGYVSLAFLNRVPNSRVVAVEPLGDVFELLSHNLRTERAKCLRCAVSEHAGAGRMARISGNLGKSSLGDEGEPVEVVAGPDLARHGQANLIKIDTEGHEAAVLRGIATVLGDVRAIVFECHRWPDPGIAETLGGTGFAVLNLMRKWSGWCLAPRERAPRGYEPSSDFVAVRDLATVEHLRRSG